MYKSKIIAGIDIGTSKVTVLLGEIDQASSLNVIGLGQCSSQGVEKGRITDYHEAADCVHSAILSAEKQANIKAHGAYLALSGNHIDGFVSEASVNISSDDGRVTREEVEEVSKVARNREIPKEGNHAVLHTLLRPYLLDGQVVQSPVNMQGNRLDVSFWTVYGDNDRISNTINIVNGFNTHVDDVVVSGLASAVAVASPEEKQSGALVIDIGRGTSDYALYLDGRCMIAGSLAVGGDHISNDLSVGLRMRMRQAESVKLRYGSGIQEEKDKGHKVWLDNNLEIGDRALPLWSIEKICEARVIETFEVIRKKLAPVFNPSRLGAGVILTGGGSRLKNIDTCAARVFETQACIGDNSAMARDELRDVEFSAALGLLHYGLIYQREQEKVKGQERGIANKLLGLFR